MIRVANIVPLANAAESSQDSEPNIAVNPANPNEIVVTAFTPDPLGGASAPLYRSTDGGRSWALEVIVPSVTGSTAGTGDITVAFGGATATGWLMGSGDRYVTLRNSNEEDVLVVLSASGRWIGVLRDDGGPLRAVWIAQEWVNPPGGSGASGWHLGAGDTLLAADVDGDGRDELVMISGDGEWIGVLRQAAGNGLQASWIGHDWVNHAGGSGASGWNLRAGDRYSVADIDGDQHDELIVRSPNGQWIGVLRESAGALQAGWIGHDWVNPPGSTGATGWDLGSADRFFVADIDGDGRDDLVVVSGNGLWIGVMRESGGALQVEYIGHDWVNHAGGSGASGWHLGAGDRFLVANLDGGRDQLVVCSGNGQWIGLLAGSGGGLAAGWIGFDWVHHPGGSGATGWNLNAGDRFVVADIDGDGRDELVVVSANGQWIGELRELSGALVTGWIRHDWINHPGGGGANGWDLNPGDRFIVADVDDDGRQELVAVNQRDDWIGVLRVEEPPAAGWIGHRFIEPPGGTNSMLYGGILRAGGNLQFETLRSFALGTGTVMEVLQSRRRADQPYLATLGTGRGADRVYVGVNELDGTNGRTASVDVFLDPRANHPSFSTVRIERRTTGGGQDGPPIRCAVHQDGTVYAAFHRWTGRTVLTTVQRAITADIVVVRDDDWARGGSPFEALVDAADAVVGQRVASGISYTFAATLGQERLGSSLSIAVDPQASGTVYLAWGDLQAGNFTLHVQRSTDRGQTWSGDLLTVASAINPALAVNEAGEVGFLCQELTGTAPNLRWQTRWRRSGDAGANWAAAVVADTPANAPVSAFLPYLGDYIGLQAVGSTFYGVFSANNTPANANFPAGVTYQRPADFVNGTLDDGAGNAVAASIDPFFVKITPPPNDAQARVSCVARGEHRRPYRRISHVGGVDTDGTRWQLSVNEAIERIEQEGQRFFVEAPVGHRADVIVASTPAGRRYLKTVADGDAPNNLLSLPNCP